MRLGLVTHWFNRGQGTVGRHLRSALDSLGHETFILARPAIPRFIRPGFVDSSDVWDQKGVTVASAYDMPAGEYLDWAASHRLEAVFFDQNYQFDAIGQLRGRGVRTIGRFVWESFAPDHVDEAKAAFDVIYSLTRCEQERYRDFGIDSPFTQWGCHPELFDVRVERPDDVVRYFYPGGYLSKRKPTEAVVEAFRRIERDDIRLILKVQHPDHGAALERDYAALDRRIEVISDDLPLEDYYRLFASCHVCIAPSRWEGLGLHLYEAAAFGMPTITNNDPPMNEIVRMGENGILARSDQCGVAASGIPAREPNVDDMVWAIKMSADREVRQCLEEGARRRAMELDWNVTVRGFEALLERAAGEASRASPTQGTAL